MSTPAAGPTAPRPAAQRLLAALALLTALASVYLARHADADLWGHLRYGRFFLETGGGADPFAFTTAGCTWSSHEYLAQVVLWLAYAHGGAPGLIALKCLLGGGAVFFLYRAARLAAPDARAWAPAFLLAAPALGRWLLFRPQLFTFSFLALFVWVLLAHLAGRRARLWLLPPLTALWVNLHGGFLAGIGAVGLAGLLRALQAYREHGPAPRALWRQARPLALTLAGCLAATLLNPLGWRLWPYLATELTCDVNRRFIDEWRPPTYAAHPWSAATLWALLAVLVAVGLLAELRAPDLFGLRPWHWLLSCAPLAFLAARSERHLPVLVIWAAPVLALLAQAAQNAWGRRRAWQRGWLLLTGLIAVPAALTAVLALSSPAPAVRADGPALGSRHPRGAAAFLRANGLRGRVYNPLWWGSYLTWELHPDVLVSMDGRNVTLFPVGQVTANLSFYLEEGADLDAPARSGADFLLVPADAPALGRVRGDARWALLYEDDQAAVFARADAAHAELLRRHREGRLKRPTAAPATFP